MDDLQRVVEAKQAALNHEDEALRSHEYEVGEATLKRDNFGGKMAEAMEVAQKQKLMPSSSEARDADALILDVDTPKAAQQVCLLFPQN